jgi:hypothetical protein
MNRQLVAIITLASLSFGGIASATPVVYEITGVINAFSVTAPGWTGSVGDAYSGLISLDTDTAAAGGSGCLVDGVKYDVTIGGLNFASQGGFNFHCTHANDLYVYDERTVGPNPWGIDNIDFDLFFSSALGGPTFSSDLPVDDFLGGFFRMIGETSASQVFGISTSVTGISRVPEPSTCLLLGVGLAGVFFARRRRAA